MRIGPRERRFFARRSATTRRWRPSTRARAGVKNQTRYRRRPKRSFRHRANSAVKRRLQSLRRARFRTRCSRRFSVKTTRHERWSDLQTNGRENRARRSSRALPKNETKKKKNGNENKAGAHAAKTRRVSSMPASSRAATGASGASTSPPRGRLVGERGGKKQKIPLMGIEPTTLALGKQRSIH